MFPKRINLKRILEKYPRLDCRRIDLMIGEKQFWRRGIGHEVIRLLTEFGFLKENAEIIFGCDIADYNIGSLKAFQKVGFEIDMKIEQPPNHKVHYCYDLVLTKEKFLKMRGYQEKMFLASLNRAYLATAVAFAHICSVN